MDYTFFENKLITLYITPFFILTPKLTPNNAEQGAVETSRADEKSHNSGKSPPVGKPGYNWQPRGQGFKSPNLHQI